MKIQDLFIATFLVLTAFSTPEKSFAAALSNRELDLLVQKSKWQEVLEKAEAVEATEWNDKWNAAVSRATLERSKELVAQKNPVEAITVSETSLEKHPTIKGHKMFMQERAVTGLKALEQCFSVKKLGAECNQVFQSFVAQDPMNTHLAFQAGMIVAKNLKKNPAAVPYFYSAMKAKANKTQCQNPSVKETIAIAIESPNAEDVTMAKEILFQKCWGNFDKNFIAGLTKSENGMKNSCAGLLEKGALSGSTKGECEAAIKVEPTEIQQ